MKVWCLRLTPLIDSINELDFHIMADGLSADHSLDPILVTVTTQDQDSMNDQLMAYLP